MGIRLGFVFLLFGFLAAGCNQLHRSEEASSSNQMSLSHDSDAHEDSSSNHDEQELPVSMSPKRSLDEMLLFHPTTHPDGDWEPELLEFEDVWFTSEDDTRLHGWLCAAPNPRAVMLFAHGNAGNLSHRAPLMFYLSQRLGVSVMIFDYRGYGRSEGSPSVAGILMDAKAARAYLAQRLSIRESEIILMGRSLGGAVMVQLASDLEPRGMVLESTFSSLKNVAKHHFALLAWMVPSSKLDSKTKIQQYRGPLLMSHGDADRTVPYESGTDLFEAANSPKDFFVVANGDHNDPQPDEYYSRLDRFIEEVNSSSNIEIR